MQFSFPEWWAFLLCRLRLRIRIQTKRKPAIAQGSNSFSPSLPSLRWPTIIQELIHIHYHTHQLVFQCLGFHWCNFYTQLSLCYILRTCHLNLYMRTCIGIYELVKLWTVCLSYWSGNEFLQPEIIIKRGTHVTSCAGLTIRVIWSPLTASDTVPRRSISTKGNVNHSNVNRSSTRTIVYIIAWCCELLPTLQQQQRWQGATEG